MPIQTKTEMVDARDVIVRKMSGRKCQYAKSGQCPVIRDLITSDMIDLPYYRTDHLYGCYISENFCKSLAAKYLFDSECELFNPHEMQCYRYTCGHYKKRSDGHHRMCVLKHLGVSVPAMITDVEYPCSACRGSK